MRSAEKTMPKSSMVYVSYRSELSKLEIRAKDLKKLRFITNEILSNCSYADKNQREQEKRFDVALVPQQQRDIIKKAWEFKKLMGELLLCDLNKFLDNYDANIDNIENYLKQNMDIK